MAFSAIVNDILTDAFNEAGVYAPGETLSAQDAALGLSRLQKMINGWRGVRLDASGQLRTTFVLPSGTTVVTMGPSLTVNITTPGWVNSATYLVPGTSPAVEVPIGIIRDDDTFAAISIKNLSSSYPMQMFPQTNANDGNATLTFWPKVSQNVTIALYTTEGLDEPSLLTATLAGPVGVAEAVLYQLALRLCGVYQKPISQDLRIAASNAMRAMQHRNVEPGMLGVDAALVPSSGAGYNVISDVSSASS